MATIHILGSMGWMPANGQQTCCVLVELGDELVMLDAGTGVANLSQYGDVLAGHDHLSILLSHYHLDHVAGLMYLKRFASAMRVDVYGPGAPAYPRSTESYCSDVLQPATYSSGHRGFAREVRYFDYGGRDFSIGRVHVGVRPQRHSAPSFELRIEDVLVYATDTCFDANAWGDVAPAHVLLHECWQRSADDPRHTSVESLTKGLMPNTFDRVVLLHQNPAWSAQDREAIACDAAEHGFELARDGLSIGVPCSWDVGLVSSGYDGSM